jgi:hypothetical protein
MPAAWPFITLNRGVDRVKLRWQRLIRPDYANAFAAASLAELRC